VFIDKYMSDKQPLMIRKGL